MKSQQIVLVLWTTVFCAVLWSTTWMPTVAAASIPNGIGKYGRPLQEELTTNNDNTDRVVDVDVNDDDDDVLVGDNDANHEDTVDEIPQQLTQLLRQQPNWRNNVVRVADNGFEGQYVPVNKGRYVHVHDGRERGFYVHIPNPYGGGYGPYDGLHILPYEPDNLGAYSNDKFQTTTLTTPPPSTDAHRQRHSYDDEGRWKIIRHDGTIQAQKYEYLYETENGIFAQEHAVVGSKLADEAGTQSNGFYQYIGDDDRIYRVDYTVGKQGYKPKLTIIDNRTTNPSSSSASTVTNAPIRKYSKSSKSTSSVVANIATRKTSSPATSIRTSTPSPTTSTSHTMQPIRVEQVRITTSSVPIPSTMLSTPFEENADLPLTRALMTEPITDGVAAAPSDSDAAAVTSENVSEIEPEFSGDSAKGDSTPTDTSDSTVESSSSEKTSENIVENFAETTASFSNQNRSTDQLPAFVTKSEDVAQPITEENKEINITDNTTGLIAEHVIN